MKKSTILRIAKERRDQLFELVRLAERLKVPVWGGPNAVRPLSRGEWRDSVESIVLVGHRTRSTETGGGSKSLRLAVAIKKSQRIVRNKVRDRLLLWDRFIFLLAQLREGEFVSCYCQGNFETVYLTVLDFPSIIVPARVLERVARWLLPRGNGSFSRTRFEKKKPLGKKVPHHLRVRVEKPPRQKDWMEKLPGYLDEVRDWNLEPELEEDTQQQPTGQKCWSFGENGTGRSVKDFATYHAQVLAEKKKA